MTTSCSRVACAMARAATSTLRSWRAASIGSCLRISAFPPRAMTTRILAITPTVGTKRGDNQRQWSRPARDQTPPGLQVASGWWSRGLRAAEWGLARPSIRVPRWSGCHSWHHPLGLLARGIGGGSGPRSVRLAGSNTWPRSLPRGSSSHPGATSLVTATSSHLGRAMGRASRSAHAAAVPTNYPETRRAAAKNTATVRRKARPAITLEIVSAGLERDRPSTT